PTSRLGWSSYGRLATGGAQPARVARLLLLQLLGQRRDAIAGGCVEAAHVADRAVVDRMLDVAGRGDAHAHPRIAHAPVQQRLRPRPDAEVGEEAQLAPGPRRSHQAP